METHVTAVIGLGRVAGAASIVADGLFEVLNIANAYEVVAIDADLLHNRKDGE